MYKQLNVNNTGIDIKKSVPRGYNHSDGLIFYRSHPQWLEINEHLRILAKDILNAYPNAKKFLDLGSGSGMVRYALHENNPELLTISIDGNRETIRSPLIDIDTHFILRTDQDYTIVDENDNVVTFDVICCFELFEHIEPKYFSIFINNIKKHSHKETVLIASAATFGGPGSVHCNVKSVWDWDNELTHIYRMKKINSSILNEHNFGIRIKDTSELHYKIYE